MELAMTKFPVSVLMVQSGEPLLEKYLFGEKGGARGTWVPGCQGRWYTRGVEA